ncbi:MAG TPA: DUF1080 domain-containing protein [Gemmataceae bacterium]|nr:DUF1080 domain-containing protein [Gemmataceae bacterium]
MTRYAVGIAVFLTVTAAAPAQKLSDEETKEGFVSLFDGKDFSGWRFGNGSALDKLPPNWKVEDDVIKLSGGASPHLASQWDYDDFDLRLEWRGFFKGYNSGVYVRSGRAVGDNQINLAQSDAGHLMGKFKGGNKVPELQKGLKEWNEWRVLAAGEKMTLWCNGKQAWEVTEFKVPRGYLGLQAEGQVMEFRNLRIKEIGYDSLSDPKKWAGAERWKTEDGALVPDGAAETAKKDYKSYVLRLEWAAEKGAMGAVGLRGGKSEAAIVFGDVAEGSGAIPTAGAKPQKKLDNPLGQWNYLEVRVAGDKGRVWLNGSVVADGVDLKKVKDLPGSGAVGLKGEGGLRVRNVRIKEAKE